DGTPLRVLDDISFELHDGEIVALLGKSGSGKSTLLRCLAGLIAPTSGRALYKDAPVLAANMGVAMVFQTFALLPWLTVRQNVELGLEARNVAAAERRERAERAIDLIGLDGFESAYPKELSGGMRQRVGFARALVVQPDALFMDEPFSALDVLTAENLRTELLNLWERDDFPTRAMLIVTHNIEEAVLLADRVLVLSSNPGRIREELRVELDRPRDRRAPAFEALVDKIYGIMTGHEETAKAARPITPAQPSPIDEPLPAATVGGMAGLLEILLARGGKEDLPALAHDLVFEVDDLLPLVDATGLLGFATVDDADIEITPDGREFVVSDILTTKQLFAQHAATRAPLVRAINNALTSSIDGNLPEEFFLDILRRGFSDDEARHQLDIAIDWGRYGELYDYDANTGQLRSEARAIRNEPDPVEA
ncbi:MAG TPA: nitrate/sulfonate/bicarbonate ABC transporter ATP-binding protein, partial [Acidimicrobiia bacterium]|nr:nitrate/sulfonate/bicarbonate ABC transporter ATP-binding protein [Acidimicrobiia bacterium]